MYAPQLYDLEVSRDTIQEFRGYNHNLRIADNEFFDMKNLTGKYYPVLSPRGKRGTYLSSGHGDVRGILGKDQLVTVIDNKVYYGEDEIFTLPDTHKCEDRQLISMGAYVIIFPDMWYLNTANTTDFGSCNSPNFEYSGTAVTRLLDENGINLDTFNMIRAKTMWLPDVYYIDISANTNYFLFGIPGPDTINVDGNNFFFQTELEIYDTAKYGSDKKPLFSIEGDYNSSFFVPVSPVDQGDQETRNEKLKKIYDGTADGNEINLGKLTVNVFYTQNNGEAAYYGMRTINLRLKRDRDIDNQSGMYKYYRTAINVGDHRIWWEGGITRSQICIKTEPTPEATYDNINCWRDENTRLRIKTSVDFVKGIQQIFDNDEDHYITADVNIEYDELNEFHPIIQKYTDKNKNIVKNTVSIVSTDEIEISGFAVFISGDVEASVSLQIKALQIPFDYMIEANNRLWACRYGKNYKGDFVNEIYASARGSFRTFFKFDGTSDDSYILTLGSDGPFTGAATLGGMPVFFKEGSCHIISGSYPSTYHLTTETGTWVASGSSKSICLADSMLYFHGKDGIYVYDGASKQKISDALGNERYKNAVGGFAGGKYYVSMLNGEGKANLFVFDQRTGMWHKEDSTPVRFFAPYGGDLYMVVNDTILTLNGSQGVSEGDVEWYAETGKIGFATPDSKYIGKLQLKMILPAGSSLQVYIQYDSDGYWEYKGPVVGLNSVCFALPIMPRRCDHFAIKLSGKGDCKIFSITKTYEAGGEM